MNENIIEVETTVNGTESMDAALTENLDLNTETMETEVQTNEAEAATNDLVNKLITWGITTIFGLATVWVLKNRKSLATKWIGWRIKRAEKSCDKDEKKLAELKMAYDKYVETTEEFESTTCTDET